VSLLRINHALPDAHLEQGRERHDIKQILTIRDASHAKAARDAAVYLKSPVAMDEVRSSSIREELISFEGLEQ